MGKNLKVTIKDVQVVEFEATEHAEAQTKPILLFEGKEKGLVLNPSNNNSLCQAYGNDSDDWVGKQVALSTKEYDAFPPGWIVTPLDVPFDDEIPF